MLRAERKLVCDIKWSIFFQALVMEQTTVVLLYTLQDLISSYKEFEADICTWYSFGSYDR